MFLLPFHCLLASSVDNEKSNTEYFGDHLHVSFSSGLSIFCWFWLFWNFTRMCWGAESFYFYSGLKYFLLSFIWLYPSVYFCPLSLFGIPTGSMLTLLDWIFFSLKCYIFVCAFLLCSRRFPKKNCNSLFEFCDNYKIIKIR